MKHEKKTLKMILAMLFVGLLISASSWAFAQEGSISGNVKDLSDNRGISGVIVKVKNASCVFRLMSPPNSAAIRHPNPEEVAT